MEQIPRPGPPGGEGERPSGGALKTRRDQATRLERPRRRAVCAGLALLFVGAGLAHLRWPAPFERITPQWVPDAGAAVGLSGLLEIAGGLGLLHPRSRRPAAWGLAALLVAVFPANLEMALGAQAYPVPAWLLWARLPLQPVLIALVLWAGGVFPERRTLEPLAPPTPAAGGIGEIACNRMDTGALH